MPNISRNNLVSKDCYFRIMDQNQLTSHRIKRIRIYLILLWVLTIIVGPIPITVSALLRDYSFTLKEHFVDWLILMVSGGLFSLPTLACCLITLEIIGRKNLPVAKIWNLLTLETLLGLLVTLFIFGDYELILIVFPAYGISVVIGAIALKKRYLINTGHKPESSNIN